MAAHISPSTIAGLSIGNSNGLFHRPHRPPRRPPDAFPRVPALVSVRSPCAAEPGDGSRRGLGCGEGDCFKAMRVAALRVAALRDWFKRSDTRGGAAEGSCWAL